MLLLLFLFNASDHLYVFYIYDVATEFASRSFYLFLAIFGRFWLFLANFWDFEVPISSHNRPSQIGSRHGRPRQNGQIAHGPDSGVLTQKKVKKGQKRAKKGQKWQKRRFWPKNGGF